MIRVILAFLLFACATAVHAEVAPGQRVRVTLIARRDAPVVGTLLAFPADSLSLATEADSAKRSYARADIALLEQSTGMHSNATKGAIIGAVAGGVAAGLIGALFASTIKEGDTEAIPLVLGAGGAVVGGLVGAAIGGDSRHETWEPVHP